MSFIEESARDTVRAGMEPMTSKAAFLCAVIRVAGEKLAELAGHDATSAEHAKLARRHAERAVGRRG